MTPTITTNVGRIRAFVALAVLAFASMRRRRTECNDGRRPQTAALPTTFAHDLSHGTAAAVTRVARGDSRTGSRSARRRPSPRDRPPVTVAPVTPAPPTSAPSGEAGRQGRPPCSSTSRSRRRSLLREGQDGTCRLTQVNGVTRFWFEATAADYGSLAEHFIVKEVDGKVVIDWVIDATTHVYANNPNVVITISANHRKVTLNQDLVAADVVRLGLRGPAAHQGHDYLLVGRPGPARSC